ncbi:MAG: AMP-binding protein [Burkholderiaceae bacterium]
MSQSRADPIAPLAGFAGPDAPAYVDRDGVIRVGQLVASVQRLLEQLPARACLLNLCVDRFHFMVGFLAGLAGDRLSLFPDTVNPWALERLAERFGQCVILIDHEPRANLAAAALLDLRRIAIEAPIRAPLDSVLRPVPRGREVAVVFTSGSTGEPRPYVKSWGDLASIGENIGAMLEPGPASLFVSTVPTQHMYGLESTVMTPLFNGMPLHRERPFFPDDVARCLADARHCGGRSILVTSPLHLRACMRASVEVQPPAKVLSATAPLELALVERCESRWGSAVMEIFGCTEVGSIAYRQPSRDEIWQVFGDISLHRVDAFEGELSTTRSIGRFAFNDHVEVLDAARFRLLGRKEDAINLAGKRASLAALSHTLRELEGIDDGCLYQPRGVEDARLVAFVVADGLTQDDIRARLRERIDAAFVPRRVFFVRSLPRNATGKLPLATLHELYERHVEMRLEATLSIAGDHPSLVGHFPGHPVVPGVVLLDVLAELWCHEFGGAVTGITQAKFLLPMPIGQPAQARFERAGASQGAVGDDVAVRVSVHDSGNRSIFSGVMRWARNGLSADD